MVEKLNYGLGASLFEPYCTTDELGRRITFYVSASLHHSVPLALFVQGSGCHSVFKRGERGQFRGGYQNILLRAARDSARVVVVEKPGVKFLDDPTCGGTAEDCSALFHEEQTLPRWTTALAAAIRGASELPSVDRSKLLIVGHSEGGIVAARLAATLPAVTHAAILASSGPTQLYDLLEAARTSLDPDDPPDEAEARTQQIFDTVREIQADPNSTSKFAWGHPYRRWSSFLTTSTLDEVLASRAKIYLAHGSLDAVVPVTAFEILRAELVTRGRTVTAERVEGADHSFTLKGKEPVKFITGLFIRIIDWFNKDA